MASSLVLCLSLVVARPSLAESPEKQAIQLAYQAKEQFEAGHFREALDLFLQAKEKTDAPTLALYIARCHKALGQWVVAAKYYAESANSPPAPDNIAWSTAQKNATAELLELEAKLPRLTLEAPHMRGPEKPQVRVDDQEPGWPVRSFPIDPGQHIIVARYSDQEFSQQFLVTAAEHKTVELPLSDRALRPEAPPPRNALKEDPPHGESAKPSPWFWSSAALVGLGATAGSITGLLAFQTAGEVTQWCQQAGNACPDNAPESSDMLAKRDLSRSLGDASTVSFIAAGVFATTAITLLILERPNRGSPGKSATRFELAPSLGVGLRVRSEF